MHLHSGRQARGLPANVSWFATVYEQASKYIAKADRYLAGWQASLLNAMGRTVLVNSVLDSQLIYAMCALPLPVGVIAQMDQRHRQGLKVW